MQSLQSVMRRVWTAVARHSERPFWRQRRAPCTARANRGLLVLHDLRQAATGIVRRLAFLNRHQTTLRSKMATLVSQMWSIAAHRRLCQTSVEPLSRSTQTTYGTLRTGQTARCLRPCSIIKSRSIQRPRTGLQASSGRALRAPMPAARKRYRFPRWVLSWCQEFERSQ
jgi:hypothetical protein